MAYSFKVEVYRFNPYKGVLVALAAVLSIVLLSLIFIRQEATSSTPFRPPPEDGTLASTPAPPARIVAPLQPVISRPRIILLPKKAAHPKANNALRLQSENSRLFKCVFKGQAMYPDALSPHKAIVVLRISTPLDTRLMETKTQEDGSFILELPVRAKLNDSLDWTLDAYTPDYEKMELSGRRILSDDSTVFVESSIAFLAL